MPHPVTIGKRTRMSYSKIKEIADVPNLIEIQCDSYEWFLKEGLKEVFEDISPIEDYTGNLILEFVDYSLDEKPKYDIEECKERDATYCAPLKVKVRLINKETGEIKEQEVFMGDFPLMTEKGTFIINGAERVIVSQLVRSPGVYYAQEMDKSGKRLISSTVIPNRGAWLEYETDSNDVISVRVDRTRKQPVTVLLRAFGIGSDAEIIELLGEDERLMATLEKDNTKTVEEGLIEIYKKLRPGEPPTVESASSLLNALFFDAKRYDLAKVGRYKFNKKLALCYRIMNKISANDIINPETGEVFVKAEEKISLETAIAIQNSGINVVELLTEDEKVVKVIGNNFVDIKSHISFDIDDLKIKEKVHYPTLKEILDEYSDEEEIKEAIKSRMKELIPKHILLDDIIASISYQFNIFFGIGNIDDIDHLGNRRIRSVGELLQNQVRIGLSRMERVIKERMTVQDMEAITPQALVNIRPVSAAIKEFFGSSQLSQFMDQTNPLSELTHKRRLSALGPGGLSRERAGFEVRDVHHSHYGRMCPIETPEGPNIGLINSLGTYAKINEFGFIESPYRKYDKENKKVTDEIHYLTADEEDLFIRAQANEPLDEDDAFVNSRVVCRTVNGAMELVPTDKVDYMDISPKQVVSIATAMIPFLENDDANRALMGSNMQRQAVPLVRREAPIIGTGVEYRAAKDSGAVVVAKNSGIADRVTADEIIIKREDGNKDRYKLLKFKRSNQGTCINQTPIISKGDKIEAGDVIADGPSTEMGEVALGRNCFIAFMTWEGYNYEDAILINERLVKEDRLSTIHIEEYECEARDTKLGPEEITRDIPNVGESATKNLDERGIIRIGAEVDSGDILVGKVTPKGETELTAEERLLRAIFGEKAREVRDTSLKVPHGESGIIVDVKVFTRENGDDLSPGVNELVRCYIAKKRKIRVGDKMAGRHGNKGVISRVLPEEDMPFMENGQPLDIVLNPQGIPSRMNIGQVLEVHLGLAAKTLGWHVATSVFDGAKEPDIRKALIEAGYPDDGKVTLYDGRTGNSFDNRITVGYMYMLKLHHLVDDKLHARSTGPYSLVTQQPLGGKAQFGGQRFGEMEVWALEAYGAAHILQEILTVKSDDVVGRVRTYEAIVKGENIPEPGIPESFKVLIKELQSLCLDVKVLTEEDQEIEVRESIDIDEDAKEFELDVMENIKELEENSIVEEIDEFESNEEVIDELEFEEDVVYEELNYEDEDFDI
ncbi:DNA-directed RNA polymerase subunit beta [Paraclostridium sordellii]|uniref:DNA-directed RNA polymerase subunit beta n=1 Tax=Paraclostridium sordellii TaxID=1505 RepID=UPI0005E4FD76|nr:DNA-directed RNA polymerase subunit beta [Paeniclostridium sordellii]AUN12847.1 DNA-directed RNA polymerase subunit beta [Paeniclostridium sordellii]MVO70180.1 DNA-directed RNA polymerase subunit beta [Paeniclostridium sordellii]CEN24343.1 DNA-directed RNA polymerase subunit beta [[Clostridium] sordellii] [Paeniclostridium sordellii]CEN26197.1 DNA-directed RNA polymerase subunit beta [[Clostridium] sordellii] [Paeniclostridium sordellii]CEN30979.1 DNA-directed RNA polymerase subunit beta [[